MPGWRLFAVSVLALGLSAQEGGRVSDVIATVRRGLDALQSDGAVAKAVHKIKLHERLDDVVIEELESAGAGPKTLEALEKLAEVSRQAPPPEPAPAFSHPAAPSAADQRRIVEAARSIALEYSRSLPDFICMEKVSRFEGSKGYWDLKDTLQVKLSYFDQKEEYELLRRNGKPTLLPYRDVGGAVSEGDFGSTLLAIFAPESRTEFHWDHWTTLRKRPAHVFAFRIALENSTYRMEFRRTLDSPVQRVLAAQHGLVYIDAENRKVVRIVAETDQIPPDFPVKVSITRLDYGFVAVGDKQYLLPARAEVEMDTDFIRTRNRVEFQDYRKFTGKATITFQ